jgi:hypothetical protein
VQCVRAERRASIATGGPVRNDGAAEVDRDDDREDGERVPRRLDARRAEADEVGDGPPDDDEAGGDENRGLSERGEMLRLAVPVGVGDVGRSLGNPEREEGQQRRNEIGAGVDRLREQAEAVRGDAGDELDRDQAAGGEDGNERCSPLWSHA